MTHALGASASDRPTTAREAAALAFFDQAVEAHAQAARAAGGIIEQRYSIGGRHVRLRFAGPTLLPSLTPALAHLAEEPVEPPALTVHLWETASTGVAMPPAPWGPEDYAFGGEVRGFDGGRFQAVVQLGPVIVSLLDLEQRQAVYWVRSASQIPFYEKAAPLRLILQMWASAHGMQLTHAGAVGLSDGGVLLAGAGGAGKSSTALACLTSRLGYAADDYCLLDPGRPSTVYSLYNTGKTHARDIQRLPFLASMVSNPESLDVEKAIYFLHEWMPDKLLRSFPLRAILIPRLGDNDATTLRPASPAAALTALAPSTTVLAPTAARQTIARLAAIVRHVPCYTLSLGREAAGVPAAIQAALEVGSDA